MEPLTTATIIKEFGTLILVIGGVFSLISGIISWIVNLLVIKPLKNDISDLQTAMIQKADLETVSDIETEVAKKTDSRDFGMFIKEVNEKIATSNKEFGEFKVQYKGDREQSTKQSEDISLKVATVNGNILELKNIIENQLTEAKTKINSLEGNVSKIQDAFFKPISNGQRPT